MPTSPVYCIHFTLANPKKSFLTLKLIHKLTPDYLRYLRRKQTVRPLPATPEKCHRTNLHAFLCFSFFHAYRVPICDRSCKSILLRHGLKFSRAWWTMQLISGEKDWKHVSVQKVVTFNTCCNVACLTFHMPHITTGSFQGHQCQPTTSFFRNTNVWRNAAYLQSDEKVVHFTM